MWAFCTEYATFVLAAAYCKNIITPAYMSQTADVVFLTLKLLVVFTVVLEI